MSWGTACFILTFRQNYNSNIGGDIRPAKRGQIINAEFCTTY
jgi:hypothetical protein